MNQFQAAMERHGNAARDAYKLFVEYCGNVAPPRVPGIDTVIRMAWRLEHGKTVIEVAAREYVYRWELAIKPADQVIGAATRNAATSVFGTPHTIGM